VLPRIKAQGYTAIQLMAIQVGVGGLGWGLGVGGGVGVGKGWVGLCKALVKGKSVVWYQL